MAASPTVKTSRRLLAVACLAVIASVRSADQPLDLEVSNIRQLAATGSWEIALRMTELTLEKYPADRQLLQLRAELQQRALREAGNSAPSPFSSSPGPRPSAPALPPGNEPAPGRSFQIDAEELNMIWIAPGRFHLRATHGSDDDTHVTISRGYWLGQTEVTQRQWRTLMSHLPMPSFFKGSERPVERVSWVNAMEYCQKLDERERTAGRIPAGYAYTLPTEAQWEFACRAGTTGSFAGDVDALAWHLGNSAKQTHAVAQKPANAWGLYDMHGNVWEWCIDGYAGYPGGEVVDPRIDYSGPSAATHRIIRGGSWTNNSGACRSAHRTFALMNQISPTYGFRLALAPASPSTGNASAPASVPPAR